MPSFLFVFLGDTIEKLNFSGTSIEDWHPGIRYMRTEGNLHQIDLSYTLISYLPPCVLRNTGCSLSNELNKREIKLELLDLTNTPVSSKLDWSNHALGQHTNALVSELSNWLPGLKHLVLAGNKMGNANKSGRFSA